MSRDARLKLIYGLVVAAIIVFVISLIVALGHYTLMDDIAGGYYLTYIATFAGIFGAIIALLLLVIFYPDETPAPKTMTATAAAVPVTPPAPKRKIKLKCPACNKIFEIEDTGKKSIDVVCPSCGRGEIFRWRQI